MQEKTEQKEKLTYDDRRKILFQKKSQVTENSTDEVKEGDNVVKESKPLSTVNHSMETEYTEDGIKLAYKNLVEEKKFHEDQINKINKQHKDVGEITPELQKLKDDIELIGKIDKANESQVLIDEHEERLKDVNNEIKSIKDAIGTRLKL